MEIKDYYKTEKQTRANAIKRYMERNGIQRAVCFSCGNASRYLKEAGVNVLDISPTGDLEALRWFSMEEIRSVYKDTFDATSGHLPMDLMNEIANELAEKIENPGSDTCYVSAGSGETIVCLSLAFPEASLVAVYDNSSQATEYSEHAPLNKLVKAIAKEIIILN